ncbi:tetratricopeptide repeat protein [Nemorincola caseinilytica]|uniref:Tetratricopeptide repeat protein n=1 Tax=Nemorincola caseinilytica TaxID=2054315 RepID=A0ABP8N5H9_9BACT
MANSARNLPGVEKETETVYPEVNPMDNLTVAYEKNKKMISTVTTVILVVVVGYFGYMKMYKEPNETKANAAMYWPQLYFQVDSLNQALNGDGKNIGFSKIAQKYSGTPAGNLAHYYAGICYLKMGDNAKAITSFQAFDGGSTMLGRQAAGMLGLAYLESGNNEKAIESFKKATSEKEDGLITPMYLYHMGMAYQATNKANEAKEAFKRIRDEYPRSPQARDMDKELARLGEVN